MGAGCREGKRTERRDLLRWRSGAGVRARIVPMRPGARATGGGASKTRPREGRAGRWTRDVHARAEKHRRSAAEAKQGAETPSASRNWHGSKPRFGRHACCRRWSTASKAASRPPSRTPGCSRFTRPGKQRDSLDEETTNWRAVCGKTARTVRRAGSAKTDPDPYHDSRR